MFVVIVPEEIVDVFVKVMTCPGVTEGEGLAVKLATGIISPIVVIVFVAVQPLESVIVTVVVPMEQTVRVEEVDKELDQA